MSQPFFEYGAQRFDAVVRTGILCAFDFDGTLAPIVKDPALAVMPASILRRLRALQEYAPVAIVTGRSLDDIQKRLEFKPDFIIGNHGVEGASGWEVPAQDYRLLCERWYQQLNAALCDHARFDPGIMVEQKTYTLSVHFRMARDRDSSATALLKLFAEVVPDAHIVAGKCVFNLLPPGAPDKGTALDLLCATHDLRNTLYIGDDVTDEDVFKMNRKDWLTIRIEHSPDTSAEFYLHHRLDLVQVLDTLIKRLSQSKI